MTPVGIFSTKKLEGVEITHSENSLPIFQNPVDGFSAGVSLNTMVTDSSFEGSREMPISILAVDDEQNLLELLILALGKRGFKVLTALSGTEALKLLDKESFQLALLDIKMGPVNGVQLLKEIKDRRPVIKVIMMTAYPTIETRLQASENGASAYLTSQSTCKS